MSAAAPRWLFPMGAGFFTQARWYWCHACDWRGRHKTDADRRFQSRLGALMDKERRDE